MDLMDRLRAALPHLIDEVTLQGFGPRTQGKTRDIYHLDHDHRVLIATDRLSAFDRILGTVPLKGQVLSQLSVWWFERCADIVPHHLVAHPDPNVMIAREATPLPIEVVVRGYITGVTQTSLWTRYSQGDPTPYGLTLPPGLEKNNPLPTPVITPTTKGDQGHHDERLTRDELLARKLVEPDLYEQVEDVALRLFARGQKLAQRAGLLLVDTKYEFGLVDGALTLIDEIHTPDSSRYWLAESYERAPKTPEHYDKEWIRLWFAAQGFRGDGAPPPLPEDAALQLAERYVQVFERLTQTPLPDAPLPAQPRIQRAMTMLSMS